MAVRLGQGINIGGMMSGNAAAADLLVEAGRAKGAGLAAIGQGLGQGLATFGANRRADKIRAEENAFRQQSRDDMLAERAADNARQDRQVGMHDKEWRATVLVNLAKQYNAEADALEQAAAASGEASLMAKAQAKRGDAARYRTALEALVSGKGDGTPEMPAPERTQPIGAYDSRVYTPPNAPVTGGGGSMDGAVTRIVDDAFSGGPGFFGPKGSYPAPEPMAPVAKPEASESAFGVKYTDSPAADIKLANLVLKNVAALRQSGKWGELSPERQNMYARAEIDANVKLGESQFGLKKQEMAFQNQMQAEDEARKASDANAALRRMVNPETGKPYLSMAEPDLPAPAAAILLGNAKVAGGAEARLPSQMALADRRGEIADNRLDKVQEFKRETMAKAQENAMLRMNQAKQNRMDIAAEARAAGVPMDQFNALFREIDAMSSQQRQLFGRAEDLADMGRLGEAQAVLATAQGMDGDLNEMMKQMREARLKIGQGAAPAAAPVDRDSARAIFDREVKARGLDPASDAARQLAADIKAGKVR